MNKKTKPVFFMLVFTGVIFFLFLLMQPLQIFFFGHEIATIFPFGDVAIEERNVLLIIQALMLLVIIPVYILTFIFSWHYRAENKKATYDPDLVDHKLAEIVWWGLPLVIVFIISVITYIETFKLDPFKSLDSKTKPIKIEVVSLQWKWLFIYPEEKIAMVNYLQIPVNTPIEFSITSDAPMNSLWIPDLGGQIYSMPGMTTKLNLIADKTGQFRGSSANISGEGFAGMHFITKSTSQDEFDDFVKSVKNSKQALDFKSYQTLSAPSQDLPVIFYTLSDENLFHQILMKYMPPETKEIKGIE